LNLLFVLTVVLWCGLLFARAFSVLLGFVSCACSSIFVLDLVSWSLF